MLTPERKSNKTSIAILLATYNGAAYLPQLLDSVLRQLPQDAILLAHDDGSSDATPQILAAYAAKYSSLLILSDGIKTGGASANFAHLLEHSRADYYMFCDQDDVWLPDKITFAMQKMRELEKLHGNATPLLVHTDLQVTDNNLRILAHSFWAYQKLQPEAGNALNTLVAQNVAVGCTMLLNNSLREMALPIPRQSLMHDRWLALVACAFGHIAYDSRSAILYRQHDANTVGAQKWGYAYFLKNTLPAMRESTKASRSQAAIFLEQYKSKLPPDTCAWLEGYATLDSLGFTEKRLFLLKHGIRKNGILRNIGFFLSV